MNGKYSKVTIFALTIILGILISIQIKNINSKYEYVSLDTIRSYKQNIEKENAEINNMKSLINDYKKKIDDFKEIKTEDGDITKLLKDEIAEHKMNSGFTDVSGPGVMIIITDASRELIEGENPNWILVHDVDILNVINELKIAGAEAISVNGQRIFANTGIDCSGYTIEINGRDYGAPYIIKAIGEPAHLEAAINAPNTTGYLLKQFGIFVEVYTRTYIKIPKYSEDISYKYLLTEK